MKRVRAEEFENQRYKIVDESILLFSRVSLSKFSVEALYISWYKGIYSRVREECEKSFFCKTGCSGDSLAIGMSPEITVRPDCHFLSYSALIFVTLQLSAYFTRVAFWRVASCKSLARSSRENSLECSHT